MTGSKHQKFAEYSGKPTVLAAVPGVGLAHHQRADNAAVYRKAA
jgi:hypothetical protein